MRVTPPALTLCNHSAKPTGGTPLNSETLVVGPPPG